jgi:hypothetical protein
MGWTTAIRQRDRSVKSDAAKGSNCRVALAAKGESVFEEEEGFEGGEERLDTAQPESTTRALRAAADVAELLGMAHHALCRARVELDGEPLLLADRLAWKLEYLRSAIDELRCEAARSSL